MVVTFTPPDPYAVEVVLPLPNVVPDTGTVEPRLPTAAFPLALFEPLEPLLLPLPLLRLWPPPPLGSGTGLRGRRSVSPSSKQDESAHGGRRGKCICAAGRGEKREGEEMLYWLVALL